MKEYKIYTPQLNSKESQQTEITRLCLLRPPRMPRNFQNVCLMVRSGTRKGTLLTFGREFKHVNTDQETLS